MGRKGTTSFADPGGRSLSGMVGSNPVGRMDGWMSLSSVCCQVEFSATSRSLVQRSHTVCRVSECGREA